MLKALAMVFVSIIVLRIISSTDGYVCAASKILEEPGFADFFLKKWYNRNLKLGMMYKATQLWYLRPAFILGLREPFCQNSHPY